jgi:hypothetical protein
MTQPSRYRWPTCSAESNLQCPRRIPTRARRPRHCLPNRDPRHIGGTGEARALCRSLGRGLPRGSTRPQDGHIVLVLTSDMRQKRTFILRAALHKHSGQADRAGPGPGRPATRNSPDNRAQSRRSGVRHEREPRRVLSLILWEFGARVSWRRAFGKPGATSRPGQRRWGAGHGLGAELSAGGRRAG